MDIAALGFSIDSRPLREAAGWLERTAIHATRAETAVTGFMASMRVAPRGVQAGFTERGDAAQAARSRAELRMSQGALEAFNATVGIGGERRPRGLAVRARERSGSPPCPQRAPRGSRPRVAATRVLVAPRDHLVARITPRDRA